MLDIWLYPLFCLLAAILGGDILQRNPFRITEDLFTSPHLCSVNIYPEPDLPSSLAHQQKEAGTFREQLIWPGFFFHLRYDTTDCAQETPTSISWPNMDSVNVGLHIDVLVSVRRIPGSHVGILVHIYILGLEVLRAVITCQL